MRALDDESNGPVAREHRVHACGARKCLGNRPSAPGAPRPHVRVLGAPQRLSARAWRALCIADKTALRAAPAPHHGIAATLRRHRAREHVRSPATPGAERDEDRKRLPKCNACQIEPANTRDTENGQDPKSGTFRTREGAESPPGAEQERAEVDKIGRKTAGK